MGHNHSRLRFSILAGVLGLTGPASAFPAPPVGEAPGAPVSNDSFYSLKTNTLAGKPADLSQYAGKVTLVVNVASQCGFTPQYKGLEALHEELKAKGFSVLGFPSNDFGGQEPGSADEIQTFCQKNYGVTFPMFGKLVTKAGPEQSEVYAYLGKTSDFTYAYGFHLLSSCCHGQRVDESQWFYT